MLTVTELTSQLDNIDGLDIDQGMALYGQIHNISHGIGQCVSSWVWRIAKALQDENNLAESAFTRDDEELAELFKKKMQEGVDALIKIEGAENYEDSDGRNTLKLSGENPLSSAFRKNENGLKKGIDYEDFPSTMSIQAEVTRLNKEAKKAQSDDAKKAAAKVKATAEVLEASPELEGEELEKAVTALLATQEEQKKARNDAARAIESVKAKHPMPNFIYESEVLADVISDYVAVLSERLDAHIGATGVTPEVALANLVDSIEGDTARQVIKIEEWNNLIIAKGADLRETLKAS